MPELMLDAVQNQFAQPRATLPDGLPDSRPSPSEPEQSSAFEITGLNVYFGSRQVLKNLSLSVRARRVTALIGPSGCGKSTLLRALNRMHDLVPEARVEGSVRLFGTEITGPRVDPAQVRRCVGMVFQKANPFPTMSIAENVTVGLRLNGLRHRKRLDEQLERSLRMAALWDEVKDRLAAPAVSLSGGQQQRLCIARALALQPEVVLMDEPASALDPIATAKIEDLIVDLKRDHTLVIVTHNLQQAARISDQTAFLYLGELIEHDATQRIFTSPKKKQTEEYVTGRFG
jgi:phosphate transport system ATP-binding protein